MATNTTPAAQVNDNPDVILSVLTPDIRGGVIVGPNLLRYSGFLHFAAQFHAIIGGVSTVALVLLLGHLITVSILPVCLSALNIWKNQEIVYHASSTGASTSGDIVTMSALPDRKSNSMTPQKGSDDGCTYGIDLERARAAADRRARARAREISRQVRHHTSGGNSTDFALHLHPK